MPLPGGRWSLRRGMYINRMNSENLRLQGTSQWTGSQLEWGLPRANRTLDGKQVALIRNT